MMKKIDSLFLAGLTVCVFGSGWSFGTTIIIEMITDIARFDNNFFINRVSSRLFNQDNRFFSGYIFIAPRFKCRVLVLYTVFMVNYSGTINCSLHLFYEIILSTIYKCL